MKWTKLNIYVGVFLWFFYGICVTNGYAQIIESAKIYERQDNQGYVMRLKMDRQVKDFFILRPSLTFAQLVLYGDFDISRVALSKPNKVIKDIKYIPTQFGLGIDITLQPEPSYMIDMYLDRDSDDLLVNFTLSDPLDIVLLTENVTPIIWQEFQKTLDSVIYNTDLSKEDTELQPNIFDVVVLDAGHGGKDPGAMKGSLKEKDINMAVVKKTGEYINKYLPDVKVVYTRTDDKYVGLKERGSIANKAKGDLFISVHVNAGRSKLARGVEVFFLGVNRTKDAFEVTKRENQVILDEHHELEELSDEDLMIYELTNQAYIEYSESFSECLEHQFRDRARRHFRGIKQSGFVVLYHSSMPSVLLELGFITNKGDRQFMQSSYGQSILASAIFRSIRDYKMDFEKKHSIYNE